MKKIFSLLLITFSVLLVGGESKFDSQPIAPENLTRWNVQPRGAGMWSENSDTLILENPGNLRPFWMLYLKKFQKNRKYQVRCEVKADRGCSYRIYIENGKDDVYENTGLLSPRKGDGTWQTITFTAELPRMLYPPYLVLQSWSQGRVEFRNLSMAPELSPGEVLRDGAILDLCASGRVGKWQLHGGVGEMVDSVLTLRNKTGKAAFFIFRGLQLEPNVKYRVESRVKADPGVVYRTYLENNTNDKWRNAGVGDRKGNGEWQTISFLCNFETASAASYAVLMLPKNGELSISEFKIVREIGSTGKIPVSLADSVRWNFADGTLLDTESLELNGKQISRRTLRSSVLSVPGGGSFRLSFDVQGISTGGDETGTHFFSVKLLDNAGKILPGGSRRFDCMGQGQYKQMVFLLPTETAGFSIEIEAESDAKICLGGFRICTAEEMAYAELQFDVPLAFNNGIFYSSPRANVSGCVRIDRPGVASGKLIGRDQYGNTVGQYVLSGKEGETAFAFTAPESGKTLTLELILRDFDGKVIFTETRHITHHPQESQEVVFNADGIALLNGKPFFPIMHWETTNRGDLNSEFVFLKEAGFNSILWRGSPAALNYAARHNLMVAYSLPETLPVSPEEQLLLAREISRIKAHPALLCYYLPDEPMWRGVSAESIGMLRDFTVKHDPRHPIWLNEAPRGDISELAKYAKLCNIFGIDIYPFPEGNSHSALPDKGLSAVGKYTDISKMATNNRRVTWMTLQAFAWDFKTTNVDYPDYHASRFMAYNAISHGATGLLYHYLGYTTKVPDHFWHDLRKVIRELNYLSPVLASRTITIADVTPEDPRISVLQKRSEDKDYYIFCNESKDAVSTILRASGWQGKTLYILGEADSVTPKTGNSMWSFPPRGVKVVSQERFRSSIEIFETEKEIPYSRQLGTGDALQRLKRASWIWYPGRSRNANDVCCFRKEFTLAALPESAVLSLEADDNFRDLCINGNTIESGPRQYGSFDLTPYLRKGINTILVTAADGGMAPCALIAFLRVVMPDGTIQELVSDKSWSTVPADGGAAEVSAEELGNFGVPPWFTNRPIALEII